MPWSKRKHYKNKKKALSRDYGWRKKKYGTGKTTLPTRNKIYSFIREVEQVIDLSNPEPFPPPGQPFDLVATTDGGVCGNMIFRLLDLPQYTEFTSGLFKQYKLNAVKMTIYCSRNTADVRTHDGLLAQSAYNKTGDAISVGNTRQDWNQVQSKRRFTLYNKKVLYFKLNQLSHISQNFSTGTGYAVARPKWISVDETDIDHYGLNLRFDSVDGRPLVTADAFPKIRIIYKYYLQCRGVK